MLSHRQASIGTALHLVSRVHILCLKTSLRILTLQRKKKPKKNTENSKKRRNQKTKQSKDEFKNSKIDWNNPFYHHHSLTPLFQNFRKRKSTEMGRDITIFISQASSRMCEYLPSQQGLSLTRFSKWHSAAAAERSELPTERAKQIITDLFC